MAPLESNIVNAMLFMLARRGQGINISTPMKTPSRTAGRPREFDRDRALEIAMHLFWRRGYEATSISDLTDAMGITPPALYGAFGDKKRLFLKSVDLYQQRVGSVARDALMNEPTAERAIRSLLLGAVKSFADSKKPKGCLVILGATNCKDESADVANELGEIRRVAEDAVRTRIAAGQRAGELADGTDIDALTGMITATLYGIAMKARDGTPPARLRAIVEQTMQMWPRTKAK